MLQNIMYKSIQIYTVLKGFNYFFLFIFSDFIFFFKPLSWKNK